MNLPSYLKSQGYIEIPFKKTVLGQIEVQVKVNGEDARLVIDTGATGTVFDEASAQRLGLKSGGVAVAGGSVLRA
jgi:predicted aspartyl protease